MSQKVIYSVVLTVIITIIQIFASAQAAPTTLEEAQRLVGELAYEPAITLLDALIPRLEERRRSGRDPSVRNTLVQALLLRARAKYAFDNQAGAILDLESVFRLWPGETLEGPSTKFSQLFENVKQSNVGELALTIDPVDATFQLDEQPRSISEALIPLTKGIHTVAVQRVGYRSQTHSITVPPGERIQQAISLERTSVVLRVITAPAAVEVLVNGSARGQTQARENGNEPNLTESVPLIIEAVPIGNARLHFRAPCYVTREMSVSLPKLADYAIPLVKLDPAIGEIIVESAPSGAEVFLDGQSKGNTPTTLTGICEGPHEVEFRTPTGRDLKRVDVRTKDRERIHGVIRPAFALLPDVGKAEDRGRSRETRLSVEQRLSEITSVAFFAPRAETIEVAMRETGIPSGWLQVDSDGEFVGTAAALSALDRLSNGDALTTALGIQGVASVNATGDPSEEGATLALLASGSGVPDIVTLQLDRESKDDIARRLNSPPLLFTHSIGLMAIDVIDRDGAEVVEVTPGSAAATAGIKKGDIVTAIGDQPVRDGTFHRLLNSQPFGRPVAVHVRRGTEQRSVQLPLRRVPTLLSDSDRTVLFNVQLVQLEAKIATASDLEELSMLRLQSAIALMHGRNWRAALDRLEQVTLPSGRGISLGTILYLKGQCFDALGQRARAISTWQEAAKDTESRITSEGPLIKDLVDERLRASQR